MPLTRPTSATSPPGAPAGVVTPPAATSEAVAAGGSVTSWTFSAFTDPDGRIASYSATLVTVTGSGSLSGSGLGPYSITGTADGDAYTVELDALDGDGGVLATAVHTVAIASGGYQTSALIFDNVDNYLEVAPVGSVPAALQFADTDPFTIAVWVRADAFSQNTGLFGAFELIMSQGYKLGLNGGRPQMQVRGATTTVTAQPSSNSRYAIGNESNQNRYNLLVAVYDGAGTATVYYPAAQLTPIATATGTPGTINYATCGAYAGVYRSDAPTSQCLNGRIGQLGVWSTDESANVADIYAGGAIIDWSTLTNPPDALHYKIETTDDPTASGGIADSSGNGLDGTMQNAVAGDLVTVTPGWSA